MKRVFETAECEEARNSIFWELRYEKHENQMKGCGVELRVLVKDVGQKERSIGGSDCHLDGKWLSA